MATLGGGEESACTSLGQDQNLFVKVCRLNVFRFQAGMFCVIKITICYKLQLCYINYCLSLAYPCLFTAYAWPITTAHLAITIAHQWAIVIAQWAVVIDNAWAIHMA